MSDPTRQQPYPPGPPAQPKSNRKLWIILGVVLGVILISMGGCVACASLLGISALYEGDQNSNTLSRGGGSGRGNSGSSSPGSGGGSTGTATGLAGGVWSGDLSCDDGDTLPVVIKVSDEGNPVYSYRTRGGDREEEITSVGQTFRFVPPEGGVFTAVVDSLSVSAERFSYSTKTSSERSGRTMTQGGGRTSVAAALSGEDLEVEVGISSSSSATQPGVIIRGDESTAVCRGRIQKQ